MKKFGIYFYQILIFTLIALKLKSSHGTYIKGLTVQQAEALSKFRTLFYIPNELQSGPQYKNFPYVFYFNQAKSPSILETFFNVNNPDQELELPAKPEEKLTRRRRNIEVADDKENEIESVIEDAFSKATDKKVGESNITSINELTDVNVTVNETVETLPTPEKFFWRTNRPATTLITFPGRLGPGFGRPFQLTSEQVRRKLARERLWLARRRARIENDLEKSRRRIDTGRYIGKDYFEEEDYNYNFKEDEPIRTRQRNPDSSRYRNRESFDTVDTYDFERETDLPSFPNSRIPLSDRPVYSSRRPYAAYTRAAPSQGYSIPILGRLMSSGSQLLNMLNPFNYLSSRQPYPPTSSLSSNPYGRQGPRYRRPVYTSVRRPNLYEEESKKKTYDPEYIYTDDERYSSDLDQDYDYRVRETETKYKDTYGSDPIYNDQEDLYERSKPQKDFPLREDLYVGKDGNIYIRNSEDDYESTYDESNSKYEDHTDDYSSKTKDDLYGLKMYGMESPKYEEKYTNSDDYRNSYDSISTYGEDDRYLPKSTYGRRKRLRRRRGRPTSINRHDQFPEDRPRSKLARTT